MRVLILVAALTVAPLVAAAPSPSPPPPVAAPIELWTRAPGQYGVALARTPAELKRMTLDLQRLPVEEGARHDAQYGGSRTYRSVTIEELIRRYDPAPGLDTALLHFNNGMAIPLPFRDAATMARLKPVVARAILVGDKWTSDFPLISRGDELIFDARPLTFQGNKLVVAERWHPSLRPGTEKSFSPWVHADSLSGIEFVQDRAFLDQFEVGDAGKEGAVVYGQVCRFCHGARHEGAQFGWDFVEPLPIFEYRKKDVSLYYHVKYRASDARERGLQMPPLPFMTERDASVLLSWVRLLAQKPLRPYTTAP